VTGDLLIRRALIVWLAIAASVAFVSGCSTESEFRYPDFDRHGEDVNTSDCGLLDKLIRQTDAIRWSMRIDGLEVETHSEIYGRRVWTTAAYIALSAAVLVGGGVPPLGDPTSEDVPLVDRADRRLVVLLAQKASLACPPRPTRRAGVSDLDMLRSIQQLRAEGGNGAISEEEEIRRIEALLDDLCPGNPVTESAR